MSKRKSDLFKRFITILVVLIISVLIVLPVSLKNKYPDFFVFNWFKESNVTLGLDLKGGTRLEYNVDLRGVPEDRKNDIINGVKNVLEGRVNELGVSEPNVYTSLVGDETHIIVELAGVDSIEQAKAVVGKVIQLEFKEENQDPSNTQQENMNRKASEMLAQILSMPGKFSEIANKSFEKGLIEYSKKDSFYDELHENFRDRLWNAQNDTVLNQIYVADQGYEYINDQLRKMDGLFILKKLEEKMVLRKNPQNAVKFADIKDSGVTYKKEENVKFDSLDSDIEKELNKLSGSLVSDVFKSSLGYTLVRLIETKDKETEMVKARHIMLKKEPLKTTQVLDNSLSELEKANIEKSNNEIQSQNEKIIELNNAKKSKLETIRNELLKDTSKFVEVAKLNNENDTTKSSDGLIGFISEGTKSKEFEDKVFKLKEGEISEIIESEEGYEIVLVENKKEAGQVLGSFEILSSESEDTMKEVLKKVREEKQITYEEVFFSTTPNPWVVAKDAKGRSLTGQFFKRADVAIQPGVSNPYVNIEFTPEGGEIFAELTERNKGKQLAIFVGGQLISAPRVNDKITGGKAVIEGQFTPQEATNLARDLNTGAIPAPITLVGQEQVGASIGFEAFQASAKAGLIGIILVMAFMILYYRTSGLLASISLICYSIVTYAVLSLFNVTLTLAGVAGLILSIGLAVDGNVLIFERMKEELKNGEVLVNAIEKGFVRARFAIMASNLSTVLTAAILYFFGSSIITGFAFALIVGTLVSMFSAIYISHGLLQWYSTKWGINKWFI